jgi:hypothetical protein
MVLMPDHLPHEEGCTCEWCHIPHRQKLMAQAKIGLGALIDETTGYQEVRPKGELQDRYIKHWNRQYRKEQRAAESLFEQDA